MSDTLEAVAAGLANALDATSSRYALLGGFAVNAYGFPRMTRDVDVCVAIRHDDVPTVERLLDALEAEGFRANRAAIRARLAAGRALITCYMGLTRLDVFLRRAGDHWGSVLANRRRMTHGERSLWFSSPEDLIALKLAARRPRDLEDARAVVAIAGADLDLGRVRVAVDGIASRGRDPEIRRALDALLLEAERDPTAG